MLKGKKRKDTICVAVPDETLDDSHIRLTKVVRGYVLPPTHPPIYLYSSLFNHLFTHFFNQTTHPHTSTNRNLRVHLSDAVSLAKVEDVKTGKKVVVVPFADTIQGLKGDLFETFVEPYFKVRVSIHPPTHQPTHPPTSQLNPFHLFNQFVRT